MLCNMQLNDINRNFATVYRHCCCYSPLHEGRPAAKMLLDRECPQPIFEMLCIAMYYKAVA